MESLSYPPPSSLPATSPPVAYVPPSDASGGGTVRGATPGPPAEPRPIDDADLGPKEVAAVSETDSSLDGFLGDAVGDLGEEAACPSSSPAVLSDELRDRIVQQVEYYFCDENLVTDKFLLRFIRKNKAGYVPIAVIASFRRMKRLTQDLLLIVDALRTSSQLVVSEDGNKVKRLHPFLGVETTDAMDGNKVKRSHPFPGVETTDAMSRTVVVDNLPDGSSEESIQRVFSKPGKVVKITLHDPQSADKSSNWKSGVIISSKVHALVEYETTEEAGTAVSTLNDDKNWRSGMRVGFLLKRLEKHRLVSKGCKTTSSEKNNGTKVEEPAADGEKIFEVDHDELAAKEEGERNKGGRRNRHKSRGRGLVQQKDSAHGHGSASPAEFVSKPIQGPRMPDGTRGFAYGRGKPAFSVLS